MTKILTITAGTLLILVGVCFLLVDMWFLADIDAIIRAGEGYIREVGLPPSSEGEIGLAKANFTQHFLLRLALATFLLPIGAFLIRRKRLPFLLWGPFSILLIAYIALYLL